MSINKTQLIEEFSKFIDSYDLENDHQENNDTEKIIDLFSLFSELVALKTEVKLESRQIKRAVDEFKKIFELLESNNVLLQKQLSEALKDKEAQQKNVLKPLLLDLLELHDRLNHNISMMTQGKKKSSILWWKKQQGKMIDHWCQGLRIVLKLIEQRLSDYQVTAIKTIGQPLNPTFMQVRSITSDLAHADGVIVEELRKGYLWGDEVLRLAEVTINKREER